MRKRSRFTAKFEKVGLRLSVAYSEDLHVRELAFSKGVVASSDRGLDLYRAPDADGARACRSCAIVCYEMDAGSVLRSFNISWQGAQDARDLLTAEVTQDRFRIDASGKSEKSSLAHARQHKEEVAAKRYRQLLEGRKITSWVHGMGSHHI